MAVLRPFVLGVCLLVAGVGAAWAQPTPSMVPHGARTIVYHPRDLVALRAKLHYTTLIVLPEGEEVVEATCGAVHDYRSVDRLATQHMHWRVRFEARRVLNARAQGEAWLNAWRSVGTSCYLEK